MLTGKNFTVLAGALAHLEFDGSIMTQKLGQAQQKVWKCSSSEWKQLEEHVTK